MLHRFIIGGESVLRRHAGSRTTNNGAESVFSWPGNIGTSSESDERKEYDDAEGFANGHRNLGLEW